jgi:hypothetical protein
MVIIFTKLRSNEVILELVAVNAVAKLLLLAAVPLRLATKPGSTDELKSGSSKLLVLNEGSEITIASVVIVVLASIEAKFSHDALTSKKKRMAGKTAMHVKANPERKAERMRIERDFMNDCCRKVNRAKDQFVMKI